MNLGSWCKRNGHSAASVGRATGYARATVARWIAGTRFPTADAQIEIYKFTNGDVTPNDWHGIDADDRPATDAEQTATAG